MNKKITKIKKRIIFLFVFLTLVLSWNVALPVIATPDQNTKSTTIPDVKPNIEVVTVSDPNADVVIVSDSNVEVVTVSDPNVEKIVAIPDDPVVVEVANADNTLKTNLDALTTALASTTLGIGVSSDVWPAQKTMFSIVKFFDSIFYQGANGGDQIYAKLQSFFNVRGSLNLNDLNTLLTNSATKNFLTATQQAMVSKWAAIVNIEVELKPDIDVLTKDSVVSFLNNTTKVTKVRDLRAKRASLL